MVDLSALSEGGSIPPVRPGDLRAVWEFADRLRAENPEANGAFGISSELLAGVCTPGANVIAVWTRSILLEVLVRQGVLAPWQRGAHLDDAVFDIAATFPIPKLDGFDQDAFLQRLRNPLS